LRRNLGLVHLSPACYGIAIAATAMLSMTGMIVALDATGRSPTTPAASPKCRAAEEDPQHHRSARRSGQYDEGGNERLRDRLGGLAALVLFADYTHNLRGRGKLVDSRCPIRP
jgi:K(+)-stimulated pyrophosphate-energized sodium pump